MHDLDFLPAQYVQERVRRRSQPWRIVVIAAFVGLVTAAVFAQSYRRQHAERDLETLTGQYDLAAEQNRKLSEVRAELQTVRTLAELFTYLRHPWPRTQLVAAVVAGVPDEVTLGQLQVSRESPQATVSSETRSRAERHAEQQENEKLLPAARDLRRLREESDNRVTLMRITGVTSDSAALHRYLGELGKGDLFTRVELDDLERGDSNHDGSLQFRASLVVRPGYGQPGGPAGR